MKILHICFGSFYVDNNAYQENLLPKFHKQLGYDVEILASQQSFDNEGKICFLKKLGTYENENGIQVTRLPYRWDNGIGHKVKKFKGVYKTVAQAKPDIIFIHGCQFMDINEIARFVKNNSSVKVYVDNHADFTNSATNWISFNVLHKIIWRMCAHKIEPYVKKFYGVLPARVDFLINVYHLPKDKCELLVMGADDDLVDAVKKDNSRQKIRDRLQVQDTDFLLMTGGKINHYRPETLNLMEAVHKLSNEHIKLVVFGVVSDELKARFHKLLEDNKIIYVGWLKSAETYQFMAAADLMVFPGLHSVMWEQAVGMGTPCLFRRIEGFDHVDLGGNAVFTDDLTSDGLKKTIESIMSNLEKYQEMKSVAANEGMKVFSYKDIARRCIEMT